MRFKVISMSGHRIDEMMADLVKSALFYLGETVVSSNYDVLLITNGFLNDIVQKEINKAPLAIYLWDDYDLPIPKNVKVICQALDGWGLKDYAYFPIAKLSIFSKYIENPIINKNKKFDLVYGGTFKENRYAQYKKFIPNKTSTLLIGDDIRWNEWHNTTRLPTIRDMDILYAIMSTAKKQLILEDIKHNENNIPLRFYECYFAGVEPKVVSDKVLGNINPLEGYTKKEVASNFKEVLWKLM